MGRTCWREAARLASAPMLGRLAVFAVALSSCAGTAPSPLPARAEGPACSVADAPGCEAQTKQTDSLESAQTRASASPSPLASAALPHIENDLRYQAYLAERR